MKCEPKINFTQHVVCNTPLPNFINNHWLMIIDYLKCDTMLFYRQLPMFRRQHGPEERLYSTTWRHIPEGRHDNIHRRDNLVRHLTSTEQFRL
jgi:hypothetical protein